MTKTAPAADNYLRDPRGLKSWLLTQDHKRIGLMFLVLISLALALGATFALLIRCRSRVTVSERRVADLQY
jgi:cytochrome c oxidase subunit 1